MARGGRAGASELPDESDVICCAEVREGGESRVELEAGGAWIADCFISESEPDARARG